MRISVIGAGPAGAMAAIRLARAGASVTLFDPSHPREKPCGGGLTGRALRLVADAIDITALPTVVIRSATVEGASGTTRVPLLDRGLTPASTLLVLSRLVFDRALVDAAVAAGARLTPERVVDVSHRGSCMVVRTGRNEFETDHVLGADGANSLVRKKFAAPFSRGHLSVAAGFFVHGARSTDIAIKVMRDQPGYLWSFPRPDHLAVGICTPATGRVSSTQLRLQSGTWIRDHRYDGGARLVPYAWPIPTLGNQDARSTPLAGPGWMLLGDAAGLVDPLTREGIYYALLSGQWAADALVENTSGADALYAARLRREILPELARAARLSGLFFSAPFSSLLVRALAESAPIRDVFVDMVAGAQPYRGLRRRLLATRQWSLAARAIPMLLLPGFAGTMNPVVLPQEISR